MAPAPQRVLPRDGAFLGVAFLGVLPGIAIAVVLSILSVFRRAWGPYRTILGDVEGARLSRHPDVSDAEQVPGLVIYRFDGPLFFANAPDLPRRGPGYRASGSAAALDHRGVGADHRRRHYRRRHAPRSSTPTWRRPK